MVGLVIGVIGLSALLPVLTDKTQEHDHVTPLHQWEAGICVKVKLYNSGTAQKSLVQVYK